VLAGAFAATCPSAAFGEDSAVLNRTADGR
jgi:hypothetical protein